VKDVKSGQLKRRYRSVVREEAARRTRRAIVLAAGKLFEERGYGGTSLSEVAAAAGVARPTVTAAFGSKPALLREVVNEALAGDDEPVPVADRPWFRPVWEAQTHHELLVAYAQVCTVIGARAAGLFEVVRRAADASLMSRTYGTIPNTTAGPALVSWSTSFAAWGLWTDGRATTRLSTGCGYSTTLPTTTPWSCNAAGRNPTSLPGSPRGCRTRCSTVNG